MSQSADQYDRDGFIVGISQLVEGRMEEPVIERHNTRRSAIQSGASAVVQFCPNLECLDVEAELEKDYSFSSEDDDGNQIIVVIDAPS